jgi:hypothetical protein
VSKCLSDEVIGCKKDLFTQTLRHLDTSSLLPGRDQRLAMSFYPEVRHGH